MIKIRAYKTEMGEWTVSIDDGDVGTVYFRVENREDAQGMANELDSAITMYGIDRCFIVDDAQVQYDAQVQAERVKNAAKKLPAMPSADDIVNVIKDIKAQDLAEHVRRGLMPPALPDCTIFDTDDIATANDIKKEQDHEQ